MTDAWATAITAICNLLTLILKDMPEEERKKSWERWFLFWEPVWKAAGLDVGKIKSP